MGRKALGKTVRFEVLKRDDFKCQYCGSKAPDAVLQVDHIHPVSLGGGNDIMNLVTACRSCNSGKRARELNDANIIDLKKRIKGIPQSVPSPEYLGWFDATMWDNPAVAPERPLFFLGWWWLLKEAARKDYRASIKGKNVLIRRGQIPRSIRQIAVELGCTTGRADRFLTRLKKEAMVEIDNRLGVSVITLCDFDGLRLDGIQVETFLEDA